MQPSSQMADGAQHNAANDESVSDFSIGKDEHGMKIDTLEKGDAEEITRRTNSAAGIGSGLAAAKWTAHGKDDDERPSSAVSVVAVLVLSALVAGGWKYYKNHEHDGHKADGQAVETGNKLSVSILPTQKISAQEQTTEQIAAPSMSLAEIEAERTKDKPKLHDATVEEPKEQPFPQSGKVGYYTQVDPQQLVGQVEITAQESESKRHHVLRFERDDGSVFADVYVSHGYDAKLWLPAGKFRITDIAGEHWVDGKVMFVSDKIASVVAPEYDSKPGQVLKINIPDPKLQKH